MALAAAVLQQVTGFELVCSWLCPPKHGLAISWVCATACTSKGNEPDYTAKYKELIYSYRSQLRDMEIMAMDLQQEWKATQEYRMLSWVSECPADRPQVSQKIADMREEIETVRGLQKATEEELNVVHDRVFVCEFEKSEVFVRVNLMQEKLDVLSIQYTKHVFVLCSILLTSLTKIISLMFEGE